MTHPMSPPGNRCGGLSAFWDYALFLCVWGD